MPNPTYVSLSTTKRAGHVTVNTSAGPYSFANPDNLPVAASIADVRGVVDAAAARVIAAVKPAPGVTGSPGMSPTFHDGFETDDPGRWINFDGSHWPPLTGAGGKWARTMYWGWPSNSGGQDPAARTHTGNKEAQSYEDKGVAVGADGLVLTATRDTSNHHGLPWTSGLVAQSRDKAILYGYFECTAKLPRIGGLWPAFWLLGINQSWPPELDVLEAVGKDANNGVTFDVFRTGVVGGTGDWPRRSDLDQWHRYGILWTRDTVTFTFDGVATSSQPTPADAHIPMFMLLNLAVGGAGSWPGEPPADLKSASMGVRSVSSWALGSWGDKPFPTVT